MSDPDDGMFTFLCDNFGTESEYGVMTSCDLYEWTRREPPGWTMFESGTRRMVDGEQTHGVFVRKGRGSVFSHGAY